MFENSGFSYYQLSPSLEKIPEEFAQILALWKSKYRHDYLPCWSDFDFYDFKGLHSWIVLFEVCFNPDDVFYRLFGSKVVDMIGMDLTGKRYSETGPNAFHWQSDLEYCNKICRNKTIGYTVGTFERLGYPSKRASFLDIPMSADDKGPNSKSYILNVTHLGA